MNEKNIHWFPGHMKKALIEIENKIKLVDCVVEIVDARAPICSSNKYLEAIIGDKTKVVIMSKKDLASDYDRFMNYFRDNGIKAFAADFNNQSDISKIKKFLETIKTTKSAKYERFGLKKPAARIMVTGIPNVGKSTFINKISKSNSASVQNTPGHTRAQQLIKVDDKFELLDTPGVLPPNYDIKDANIKLALIGTIKQDILPIDVLANYLASYLISSFKEKLVQRYDISKEISDENQLFFAIAESKKYMTFGNDYDVNRAKITLLNDFKEGRITRINLDKEYL